MFTKIKTLFKGRKQLAFTLFLIITVTAFLFTKPEAETNSFIPPLSGNISDSFLIAAMDNGKDHDFHYIDDSLGFNLWHYYGEGTQTIGNKHYPYGWMSWAPGDTLFAPISAYETDIRNALTTIGSHNMKAFMQRPKIEYLCYGQRSDYQCEDISEIQDQDLWFYTFQSPNHKGTDIPDGNAKVRFCQYGIDNAGMVVSRLRTNNEQCHRVSDFEAWRGDSECDWFIKPRIRGDQNFISNQANENVNICRVDVYNQNGFNPGDPSLNRILSVDIKARYFQIDYEHPYNGQYLEEFYFPQGINLTYTGDWGDMWYFTSRGSFPEDEWRNKSDIQVYWYGNCDMWIDYVRVDNDIADRMFKGYYDDPEHPENQWLKMEAELVCEAGYAPLKFYIELAEFNNIPCIAYVNQKLNAYCGKNIDMIADQFTFYQYHMCWDDRGKITTPDQIIRQYIDRIGMKQIYYGWYPFQSIENRDSTYSRIPNTLPNTDTGEVLAKPIAPNEYDAWLQGNLARRFNILQNRAAILD